MLLSPAEEKTNLRIRADRLGTVAEVRSFLIDIENVYNALYVLNQIEKGSKIARSLFFTYKKHPINSGRNDTLLATGNEVDDSERSYAIERYTKQSHLTTKMYKQVGADDHLLLIRVNVQSPGFWEFVGTLSPLTQLREYLKDRHERKKDLLFRDKHEKRKGELENANLELELFNKTMDMMIKAGNSQEEIKEGLSKFLYEPLKRLGSHQDTNLIEGPEEPPRMTGVSVGQIV